VTDVVYCLALPRSQRTYVGVTNDLTRRLRQHNGDITGGARYTSMRAASSPRWAVAFTVCGFATRGDALSFEWHLKRRSKLGVPRSAQHQVVGKGRVSVRRWAAERLCDDSRWRDMGAHIVVCE